MAKNTNTTASATSTAAKTKIEQFGDAILKAIREKTVDVTVSEDAGKKTFAFSADFGRGMNQYKLVSEQVPVANGKSQLKRELYVYSEALGKDRVISFGSFKRKYLYAAVNSLEKVDAAPKNFVADKAFVTKIMQAIRANNADFKQVVGEGTSTISGKVDGKAVELVTTEAVLKGNKTIKRHTLKVDGEIMGSGCKVNKLYLAYSNPYKAGAVKMTKEEIQASADASVGDLI